jgi:hypothetical protein
LLNKLPKEIVLVRLEEPPVLPRRHAVLVRH